MENYLVLNGKRIDLTDEQVKTLTAEEKKNPFARVEIKDTYYFIGYDGKVFKDKDIKIQDDDVCFSIANYCADKSLMEQRALHETLNRLLWRYSEEHGGDNAWDNNNIHWAIFFNEKNNTVSCSSWNQTKQQGLIYFKDEKTAQSAIEEIVKPFMAEHPEFVW